MDSQVLLNNAELSLAAYGDLTSEDLTLQIPGSDRGQVLNFELAFGM